MQLSTRTRYGLRLLLGLAMRYNQGYIQLHEIARTEEISVKYLEQIVRFLKSAGLVLAQRGAQGGYMLAYPPDKITVRNVVEVLEGTLSVVDCLDKKACGRMGICIARNVWDKLTKVMQETLEAVTLASLMEECQKTPDGSNFEI